ncbi:MAG: hypothetical protein WCV99_08300 [Sterolibacterium sp.]
MSSDPLYPASRNISLTWAEAFLRLNEPGVTEISPAVIVVTEFADGAATEDRTIRGLLDSEMARLDQRSCEDVASTIFPISMWNPSIPDNAEQLFRRYDRIWPSVKHRDRANNRGNYFRRLTAYCPEGNSTAPVNQLQHVIETFRRGNHRRSALQAAVFDPTRDHVHNRILGFPCLQQIGFAPVGDGGLAITGFYPLQYLFEKAYGNYLGLCRLGNFMAVQMGLTLVKMTCIASALKLGNRNKTDLITFARNLRAYLAASGDKG